MLEVGTRFSGSTYINIEFDPENNKATITAVVNNETIAGAVTLTAVKAAKMRSK